MSEFIRKQEGDTGMEASAAEEHDMMIAEIFDSEDADKDGMISHDEFSGPKHDEF